MIYHIIKDNNIINTITADENFIATYCKNKNCTYEVVSNIESTINNIKKLITELESILSATDYKIIKCYEYQLAELELPYDVAELHAERQALRDEINVLEEKIAKEVG